jgi:two-component system, chemotaxis family, protein-glutamate methylesterase/glutaminase
MTSRAPLPVLIVDDSAVARQALKAIVEVEQGFVALLASDPYEAVEVMKRTVPAAIVLDVNMPRMDGLTFLRKLMRQHPLPVLLCTDHPVRALEGLEIGAIEVIPKPRWEDPSERAAWGDRLRESLHLAIAAAASGKGSGPALMDAIPRLSSQPRQGADAVLPPLKLPLRGLPPDRDRIIAVGVSTGGVQAIGRLLAGFPKDAPGIVVVQHMPGGFTAALAERLDRDPTIPLEVAEARHGEPVRRGRALIVPGGDRHGVVRRVGLGYRIELVDGPPVSRFRPSVDVLFRSTAQAAGDRAVGVILTGMLDDGAQGLLEMSQAGSWTIAQDRATSTVFGMNAEAIRRGAARQVLPLDRIADAALAGGY